MVQRRWCILQMRKVVLVTGASGFLGAQLVKKLASDEYDVHCIQRSSECSCKQATYHLMDLRDTQAIQQVLEKVQPDCIFHLAAVISYAKNDRVLMESVNVHVTEVLATCASSLKKRPRFIFCSSIVTIGANATEDDELLNEESYNNLKHLDFGYFETKRQAEVILLEKSRMKELDVVIVNPSNIYGCGDAAKSSRKTQVKVAQGEFPFYPSGGINIVHVDDVVNGLINAWKYGVNGNRYILGGENMTSKRMFEIIALAGGSAPPFLKLPMWFTKVLVALQLVPYEKAMVSHLFFYYSSEKAMKELNYSARPGKQALVESVDWMKEHFSASSFKNSNPSLRFLLQCLFLLLLFVSIALSIL